MPWRVARSGSIWPSASLVQIRAVPLEYAGEVRSRDEVAGLSLSSTRAGSVGVERH